MIIAGHQPHYLPNLAYFSKMLQADVFVVVSNLQFEKQEGWQQRNRFPVNGRDAWLTVPVLGSMNQQIRDVKINNAAPWRRKHARTLKAAYGKAGREPALLADVLSVYEQPWERLVDLNFALIKKLSAALDISTPVVLDEETGGRRHDLVINICRTHGADTYLSGAGGHDYMDEHYLQQLERAGITHRFVEHNLSAQYPYAALHYMLANGVEWVQETIAVHKQPV